MNEAERIGCDGFLPVNELGLCADCAAMCERDLIRMRKVKYATLIVRDRDESIKFYKKDRAPTQRWPERMNRE